MSETPPSKLFDPDHAVQFAVHVGGEPTLVLDKDGFVYLGVRITDAGKAHKAFIETMNQISHKELLKEVYTEMITGGFTHDALMLRVKEAIQ